MWGREAPYGELLTSDGTMTEAEQGRAMIRHVLEHEYEAVVINPPQRAVEMNLARYLPASVLRMMVIHTITPGSYTFCRGIRDHLHAAICISPRQKDDLTRAYGFAPERLTVVPTAIDMDRFGAVERPPRTATLRLLSFGRIDDSTKSVFSLVPMMQRLAGENVRLTVAGEGPDLPELRKRVAAAGLDGRVSFAGRVEPVDVPRFLVGHDVFIMPSRTEGLGLALVEAMAAGCVPVASRIRGVTDFVVAEGRTGYLVDIADVASAVEAVRGLAHDRDRVERVSQAARADAQGRFTVELMGAGYAKVLKAIKASPPPIAPPLPQDRWSYPRGFRPGYRRFIPQRLKDIVRRFQESRRGAVAAR
jgi:glycosyltransferase involved in cell wall biosynthesis